DPAQLAGSRRRLDALKRLSRPRHAPAEALRDGDVELLAGAAARGMVALGELPRLRPGARVLLVAAQATRQSAATQATVSPAAGLADALREHGVEVVELPYEPPEAGSVIPAALQQAASADLVLFASTARTRLLPAEVELAKALSGARRATRAAMTGAMDMGVRSGPGFVHVALWNPYLSRDVPGPALVTFGWREHSVRAAADVLV